MGLRLTQRGKDLLAIQILTIIIGWIYRDLLLAVGLVLACVLSYHCLKTQQQMRKLPTQVVFNEGMIKTSSVAGGQVSQTLEAENNTSITPFLKPLFGEIKPSVLRPGVNRLRFVFTPMLAAIYKTSNVEAVISDPLGLFQGSCHLKLGFEVKAYPRVYPVVLQALEYLEGSGLVGVGEQVSKLRGRGYEYAESREYVTGDDFSQVDWKATARLSRLIVKEFYQEATGAIQIIYDPWAPDPATTDTLAASFLQAVLSFAEAGWPIAISVLHRPPTHYLVAHPAIAVTTALRYALEVNQVEPLHPYHVLDPARTQLLQQLLKLPLPKTSEKPTQELDQRRVDTLLIVSSLTGETTTLLELAHLAKQQGIPTIALQPSTPWTNMELEEAYITRRHVEKVCHILQTMGVQVAATLEEAQAKLGQVRQVAT